VLIGVVLAYAARRWCAGAMAVGAAAAVGGCAGHSGGLTVQEAMRREIAPLPLHAVTSADGAVSLQTEAMSDPTIAPLDGAPNRYVVTIPLGDGSSVSCGVFAENSFTARATDAVRLAGPTLEAPQIAALDAGAIVDRPFLYVEVMGRLPENGVPKGVAFKYLGAALARGSVVCTQPGLGYQATFKRIVSGLVGSLHVRYDDALPRTTYHEIQIVKAQGRPVGFVDLRFCGSPDSSQLALKRGAMMIPRTPSEWLTTDTLRADVSTPSGEITRAGATAMQGDATEHDLKLTRVGAGYHVAGTVKGKAVSADLHTDLPLPDDRQVAHRIERAARTNGPWPVRALQWAPDVSPLELIDTAFGCSGNGATPCQFRLGSIDMDMAMDQSGMAKEVTFTAPNGVTLSMQRVFVSGGL
jgi:hypothetical protein